MVVVVVEGGMVVVVVVVSTADEEDEEGVCGVCGRWAVSRVGSHCMAAAARTATSLTGSSAVEKAYTWMRGRVVGLKMQR